MWNPFRRRKQNIHELSRREIDALKLHVAGATVRHNNFEDLKYYKNPEQLSIEFIDKWVNPFYMTDLNDLQFSMRLQSVAVDLNTEVIKKLLGDFNWRTRITGAHFAAITHSTEFEEQIGNLFLKSEVTYAADGYVLALASFNTNSAIKYLTEYLNYYLERTDLWFDQNDAMAALKWLDDSNKTNYHKEYLGRWEKFIEDKPNWSLDRTFERFERGMQGIKRLAEELPER